MFILKKKERRKHCTSIKTAQNKKKYKKSHKKTIENAPLAGLVLPAAVFAI